MATKWTPGDHIKIERSIYYHHGIYIGDGRLIHYCGEPKAKAAAAIEEASVEEFLAGSPPNAVDVVSYDPHEAWPAEEVVAEAKRLVGERRYSLVVNNCEHFATWCKTREHRSEQVTLAAKCCSKFALGKVVAHAGSMAGQMTSSAGATALLAAPLLPILQFGLGLHIAAQGHVTLTHVMRNAKRQAFILTGIDDLKGQMSAMHESLHAVMQEGFERVINVRREDEFRIRMAAFQSAYDDVLIGLGASSQPPRASDVAALEDAARDLRNWAAKSEQDESITNEARSRWLLTWALAARAKTFAMLLDAPDHRTTAAKQLERTLERLRKDLRRVHHEATPWELVQLSRDVFPRLSYVLHGLELYVADLSDRTWDDSSRRVEQAPPFVRVLRSLSAHVDPDGDFFVLDSDEGISCPSALVDDAALPFPAEQLAAIPRRAMEQRLGISQDEERVPLDLLHALCNLEVWSAYVDWLGQRFGLDVSVEQLSFGEVDNITFRRPSEACAQRHGGARVARAGLDARQNNESGTSRTPS